jgi:hypothetical protein
MKTSILLSVFAFSGFIGAATHLLPRAIGDACKAPEVTMHLLPPLQSMGCVFYRKRLDDDAEKLWK